MYTIYLAGVGEVSIPVNSILVIRSKTYLIGHDCNNRYVNIVADKVSIPRNQPGECGYCHIVSYVHGDTVVNCDLYQAIH
jgi:hypothetical protein